MQSSELVLLEHVVLNTLNYRQFAKRELGGQHKGLLAPWVGAAAPVETCGFGAHPSDKQLPEHPWSNADISRNKLISDILGTQQRFLSHKKAKL